MRRGKERLEDAPMRTLFYVIASLAIAPVSAFGQANKPDPYSARILLGSESYTWESVREAAPRVASRAPIRTQGVAPSAPPIPLGTQRVLDYYGGMQARMALSQMPTRNTGAPAAPTAAPRGSVAKPFNTVVKSPTVSPYLNLYREEQGNGAPNYHSLVRPQQQQFEANQQQAQRLRQLERNIRQASTFASPSYSPSATAGAARFGDTGRYYQGWSR